MALSQNLLLEISQADGEPKSFRVLRMEPQSDSAFLFEMTPNAPMPMRWPASELESLLETGGARILPVDPCSSLNRPEEEIPEKHKQRRDKDFALIEPLIAGGIKLFDPNWRGQAVAQLAIKTKKPRALIYRLLKRYWRFGQTRNALLPLYENCGGPGKDREPGEKKRGRPSLKNKTEGNCSGVNVGEKQRDLIIQAIKFFYEKSVNGHRRTLREAFKLMQQRLQHRGHKLQGSTLVPVLPHPEEVISFGQFKYWHYKTRDLKRGLVKREGERRYAQQHREVLDDASRFATGPGEWVQLDSTRPGIHLVSRFNPNDPVGTPVLYFATDVFSGAIIGFYAGIENPSYSTAALAILNVGLDKVEYYRQIGIEIEPAQAPCPCIPINLVVDQGELAHLKADTLNKSLGISVVNVPPYRPDLKGRVERDFRTLEDQLIAGRPGATRRDWQRGDPDPRLKSIFNTDDFLRLVALFVLQHNRSRIPYRLQPDMIRDRVQLTPLAIWEWGVKNRSGHLRTMTADALRINLLPHDRAIVTHEGIRFKGVFYTCKTAIEQQWFVRARHSGRHYEDIAYDPQSADVIYLRRSRGQPLERCELLPKDHRFQGKCWDEIDVFFHGQKLDSALAEPEQRQNTAEYDAKVAEIERNAKQRSKAAREPMSNSRRVGGMRDNRLRERELNRQEGKDAGPALPISDAVGCPEGDQSYVAPPSHLDLLRQQQETALNDHEQITRSHKEPKLATPFHPGDLPGPGN